jgi:CO dehydrogenase maturation factor
MSIIVVTGRGGVGKSTFAALAIKHFAEKEDGRILAVDADPDTSLAEMLGVDLEAAGIRTISDLLYDIKKKKVSESVGNLSFTEQVEYLFHNEFYESKKFDLVALGTKWDRGCYCSANNQLRSIMEGLVNGYNYVVVDSPGGLEHLNRKLFSDVDAIIQIVDASKKARANLERSRVILAEVGVTFKYVYVVAGAGVPESLEKELAAAGSAKYLGRIPDDEAIVTANMNGDSLLDLPADSPAVSAVAEILKKTEL